MNLVKHITVTNRVATYTQRDGDIICSNSGYKIAFRFDAEWAGKATKYARFIWNGMYEDVAFTGNECDVPVIQGADFLHVGVCTGDPENLTPDDFWTTTPARIPCRTSVLDLTDQAQGERVQQMRDAAIAAAELAVASVAGIEAKTQAATASATSAAASQQAAAASASSAAEDAAAAARAVEAVAGGFGCVWNAGLLCEFNTTDKTLTIPQFSRIIYGGTVILNTGTGEASGATVDLSSAPHGYVVFDKTAATYRAQAYSETTFSTGDIVLFVYSNYGADYVAGVSSYKIDGNLFGIDVPDTDIADRSITTAKLADGAATIAKRTPAGSFAVLWNSYQYPEFNTTAKTFTIPGYSRIFMGAKIYFCPGETPTVVNLTAPHGFICFDTKTSLFTAYTYEQTEGVPETSILLASYADYGRLIHMACSYKIDGKLFGIDVPDTGIADRSITTAKLADGAATIAKRTPAGNFAVLWNSFEYPEFNTTAKTFTIPQYSRIFMGAKIYFCTGETPTVVNLTVPHGFICFDTATSLFTAYTYEQTEGVPETSILLASYADYGRLIHMACSYKIDGNLFGIDVPDTDIADKSITTSKLADGAVTLAKRAPAGSFATLWNAGEYPEFNTTAKTFTIPGYSRILMGSKTYFCPGETPTVVDLDSSHGFICFDTITSLFTAYTYDTIESVPETSILIASYANHGKVVNMACSYKIDGKLLGIDTDKELEIPDGSITKNKLAPKVLQTQLSRCPSYTFTDMSALGVQGWSDICIIGDNLWMFFPSTGEDHATADGTIKIVNKETLETVKTINHDFGHVNTCDYCKETDSLIVGNLPGSSAYPAALYIFYNISEWMSAEALYFNTVDKAIIDMRDAFPAATAAACSWGESNFAYHNIAYVSFDYDRQFTKIVLGMGSNRLDHGTYSAADDDKFNGTYNVIMTSDFEPMGSFDEVMQGATFYKGQMLTANGDADTARASLWQFDINGNIQRELLEFPIYNADGKKNSRYNCYTEGIAVDDETGYIYQGIFSGQLYAIRFYLIKYKI